MNKIWKLRRIICIILTIVTIIIVIFSIFNLLLLLIVPVIWTPSFFIVEMMVIPKFREIEVEEKEKESKQKKYDPIKKIIDLLEKYENIKNTDITEKKYINELLILFEKLTLIGFGVTEPNTFEDDNYRILITPSRKKRFYIKDQNSNKMYYSKKYEQEQNSNVLYAFIIYLKDELNKWLNSNKK